MARVTIKKSRKISLYISPFQIGLSCGFSCHFSCHFLGHENPTPVLLGFYLYGWGGVSAWVWKTCWLARVLKWKFISIYYTGWLVVADLSWCWLWFSCSAILPSCPTDCAKFLPSKAELSRQWKDQNQIQTNPEVSPIKCDVLTSHSRSKRICR